MDMGLMTMRRRGLAGLAALLVAFAVGAPPASARAPSIPFSQAEVASADGHSFTIAWAAPARAGKVEVFARTTPRPDGAEGLGRDIGGGGASASLTAPPLPDAARWYFELRPAHGAPLVIADRSLHLASAPNFRDVGGYRTADGRWVKMGVAFRSDQLDRLTDPDLAKVARISPALIVDLRTADERRKGPDRTPPGAEHLDADVLADAKDFAATFAKAATPEDAVLFMDQTDRDFVALPSAQGAYGQLFNRLQSTSGPVVYHCTAGKDRTGWATAVLLTLLGVPRETVMADYMASNGHLREKNRAMMSSMPPAMAAKLDPVFTVRAAYLNAAFEEVGRRYGSFDRYLTEGLGLDKAAQARLRARFLDGAPTS